MPFGNTIGNIRQAHHLVGHLLHPDPTPPREGMWRPARRRLGHRFRERARRKPRSTRMRITGSTSKASTTILPVALANSASRSVAKFANAEEGGLVVAGMAGKKFPGGERIHRVCPVPLDSRLIRKYQQVLESRLYPPPDYLTIEAIAVDDGGLMLIAVPAQPDDLKPFLVHGAIVDGREERSFISIIRRNRQDLWIGCVGAWPVYGSRWWASWSALSWWMALSMAWGSVRSMPLSVRAAATFLAGPQAVSLSKASSKTGR